MYVFLKRVFDFIFSLLFLIILSPVFLVIAISIKIDSKGPVFFNQKRLGKNGTILYIYKFRTMVDNAESLIASFTPEQLKEWKENYKLTNDIRITKVGKFLRRSSLDELPQLLNILKGEMSFVGPRPVIEGEVDWYGDEKDKFLSVKPGLTGWWACNGRSEVAYPERCTLELYYVDHASVWLDIKVLFKTILSVFEHKGAR